MQKLIFMLDRLSGRIITVCGNGKDTVSFTFLPDFRRGRLARVTFSGLTNSNQVGHLAMWHGADIIKAGVYKSLGMNCECRYAINRILTRIPHERGCKPSITVEA